MRETEEYFQANQLSASRYDIAMAYKPFDAQKGEVLYRLLTPSVVFTFSMQIKLPQATHIFGNIKSIHPLSTAGVALHSKSSV